MLRPANRDGPFSGGVGNPVRHDSAIRHVTGRAIYIDDLPEPIRLLHVHIAMSERARAKITRLDLDAVRTAPGVATVITTADIPGRNDVSPVAQDEEPVFAAGEAAYAGQPLFAVVADSRAQARAAAGRAKIGYTDLDPVLTIADARVRGSELEPPQRMSLGDAAREIAAAPRRVRGRLAAGGQDHFYLEGQVCLVIPEEGGDLHVFSSTQNPTEVQHIVARVLGKRDADVTVEVRRMGGGFGGKETQPALFAAIAALAAEKTRRPVKVRLDRDDDMIMTGKRHNFEIGYDVGYDDDGRIGGVELELASRCGYSADLSLAVNDRAMFHADNAYFLNAATVLSRRYRTNTASNTAFRGFGGPQGMLGIERAIDVIALQLGKDPLDIRKLNLYGPGRDVTPYRQTVEDNILPELMSVLEENGRYRARRAAIRAFNETSPYLKRGIALTPVKFGISFTNTHLNQAGALIHIYTDGSIHLNHGGTEMGQGLMTKVAQIVAEEFQVDIGRVKIMATTTGKVPNTSATAASAGSDLNGMAAQNAARTIKNRLIEFASESYACNAEQIVFADSHVVIANRRLTFEDLVRQAYRNRVSLSAAGFYRTPKIHYDRKTHRGRPFFYYAYGAAIAEVAIDTLTGENKVAQVDILHDAGASLNPAIDLGQIEGGFIQGMGWLTTEELKYDERGRLLTHAPSTYKIPVCGDRPEVFNIALWDRSRNNEQTVYRSKAVGEPPLMLALSVFSAFFDALAGVANYTLPPCLDAPATPERILQAVNDLRVQAGETLS